MADSVTQTQMPLQQPCRKLNRVKELLLARGCVMGWQHSGPPAFLLCRSVYAAAVWYYNHLAGLINVVMITEDQEAVAHYGNLTAGVYVITVRVCSHTCTHQPLGLRGCFAEPQKCCRCRTSCRTSGRSCGRFTSCTPPLVWPCKKSWARARRGSTPSICTPESWRRESRPGATFRYRSGWDVYPEHSGLRQRVSFTPKVRLSDR